METIRLMDISTEQLITVVVIVSLSSIGLIQFIKETAFFKRRSKRLLSALVILGVTLVNTTWSPPRLTGLCNIFLLSFSLVKIGYDTFIEGIPRLISNSLARLGAKKE